jgi:hypothetical protein
MKNKFLFLLMIIGVIQLNTSCKKSFLELVPIGSDLETNYYQNADQAYSGLISVYNPMLSETGGGDNTYISDLGALNSASDECYAGGGSSTDMSVWQAMNNYTVSVATGPQAGFWSKNFTGIYRANLLLLKIDAGIPGLSDALKTRYIAECKFLRGYYYFNLVRLFKNVPLFTAPVPVGDTYTVIQAKPEDVWAQVEKDLKDAIPGLPSVLPSTEYGRITKGAAQALLGKAILFQNNESRMKEAADLFELVNISPNYGLLTDFASIFSPDNKFNKESVFEIYHTGNQKADWGSWNNFLGNLYVDEIGPRSYTGPVYASTGWGFNPLIVDFVNLMKTDPRYKYTVANVDSIVNAGSGRSYLKGYQNTGYFIQKYAPLAKYIAASGSTELNFPNDYIEIRLADTYLMEAEALVRSGTPGVKAQFYLDAVRARVGLPSVPATLDNIYNERKFELATEGHRWYDLVRTGKAASVLAFKGFKAGKNELLPIPLQDLNSTKLVQNPGYN